MARARLIAKLAIKVQSLQRDLIFLYHNFRSMIRVFVVLVGVFCCLGASQLLDFGMTSLSYNGASSNNIAELTLQRPIVFYGASFSSIFVSSKF